MQDRHEGRNQRKAFRKMVTGTEDPSASKDRMAHAAPDNRLLCQGFGAQDRVGRTSIGSEMAQEQQAAHADFGGRLRQVSSSLDIGSQEISRPSMLLGAGKMNDLIYAHQGSRARRGGRSDSSPPR